MTINRSELGTHNALVNEIAQLRKDFNELRTTPQPIGNGSMNYAVFSVTNTGPFTIPAGLTANITVMFMDNSLTFTYDGKPAINRRTLIEPLYSVKVDTNDTDHIVPYGALLTSGQRAMRTSWWWDYNGSGLTETNGQRYFVVQVNNADSSSHNYWVDITALIPRPALKPQ